MAWWRVNALLKNGCVSEKARGSCDIELLDFYAKLLVMLYAVLALSNIYFLISIGTFDGIQLSAAVIIRVMFAILRASLFFTLVQTSHLYDLKLKTQVLSSGLVCILGISETTKQEAMRVKVPCPGSEPDRVYSLNHSKKHLLKEEDTINMNQSTWHQITEDEDAPDSLESESMYIAQTAKLSHGDT